MENADRHDDLYREGLGLIDGLLLIHDKPESELTAARRSRLTGALSLFEEVVRLNPQNWSAYWIMGKIYQRLEDCARGLNCFAAAHQINPGHPDVAREASIAAMDLGEPAKAVGFCERAIAAKPSDGGLRANLALALLFSGRPADALPVAEDSVRRSPDDPINRRILAVVREVLSGSRSYPRHVRDLNDGLPEE